MPRATPKPGPPGAALALLLAACTAPAPAPAPRPTTPLAPVLDPPPAAEPRGLADRVEVHGHVRAWGGAAIAGATITARDHTASARSDADGRFTLALRPGGLLELHAEAPGHAPGLDEGPAPGHAFALWLAPESTLAGTVTRAGSPIAGALVRAERAGGLGPVTAEALTDAAGHYAIPGLEPGSYSLRALTDDAAGEAPRRIDLGLAQHATGLDIPLTPALRITGRILGGDAPCESGSLSLIDESRGQRLTFPTGPEGQVNARGLPPGEYQVTATCTGFLPGTASRVRLLEGPLLDQR